MSNMVEEYLKERQNCEFIKQTYGFATYSIKYPFCYIQDMYIKPYFRKQGYSAVLADLVRARAVDHKCTYMITTVNKDHDNSDTSNVKAIEAYGFELLNEDSKAKYYIKRL